MQPAEKRKNLRRTIRYPGSIDMGADTPPLNCTLCDASDEGAQILVDKPGSVPDEFTLVLGYDGSARRQCRVAWRSDTQVGVEFIKSPPSAPRRPGGHDDASDLIE